MDPALKQRLLGAAVLVALAIIFLPMLFDGPAAPPPPASQLPLDVPAAPDRPLQTREIPIALPSRLPSADAPIAPAGEDSDRVATVDVPAAPRVDALADTPASVAAPTSTSTPATATAPTPAPAPPAQPASPPASAPAPAPTPAPAAALTEPAGQRFVVNLGSYGNAANARALLGRLKGAGVRVYDEAIQLDGKPATRLRAGPFASRSEADAAAAAARRVQPDVPAAVVALEAADAAPARPAPAVAGGFVVQVGAFKSEAEANGLRDRLRGGGYAAFVERVQRAEGTLWRVRVGPEVRREKSEETRIALRQRYQLEGQVLTHP